MKRKFGPSVAKKVKKDNIVAIFSQCPPYVWSERVSSLRPVGAGNDSQCQEGHPSSSDSETESDPESDPMTD